MIDRMKKHLRSGTEIRSRIERRSKFLDNERELSIYERMSLLWKSHNELASDHAALIKKLERRI